MNLRFLQQGFLLFTGFLTLASIVFISLSFHQFSKVRNAHEAALILRAQASDLSQLVSEDFAFNEPRESALWQRSLANIQRTLDTVDDSEINVSLADVESDLQRLASVVNGLSQPNEREYVTSSKLALTLQLTHSVSRFDTKVSEIRESALQQLLMGGLMVPLSLLLFLASNVYTRRLLERAKGELTQANQKLSRLAYTDGLTGFLNRKGAEDWLSNHSKSELRAKTYAFILIDVDYFKAINDTFSRQTGDMYLKALADTLAQSLDSDSSLARLEAGQFLFITSEVDHAVQRAESLRCVADMVQIDYEGVVITRSVSIGVAITPVNEVFSEQLHFAELALDKAKVEGRNRVVVADEQFRSTYALKQSLITSKTVSDALKAGEFCYFLQPIYDTTLHKPAGFEALIRWQRPDGKVFAPAVFLPYFVREFFKPEHLPTRVAMHQEVMDSLHGFEGCYIAWNFDLEQFASEFVVSALLMGTEPPFLNPDHPMVLEVSENAISERTDLTLLINNLERLREAGYLIALDDFGVQQSNLHRIINLPLDIVKVDKSLIDELSKNPKIAATVRFISLMAKSLGLKVVAEGMETYAQSRLLSAGQIRYQQGYFHSKPMPLKALKHYPKT